MHRAMPDIYDGELTDVIDEVFDAPPAVARTTSRAFVPIGNGHAAWEMALTNTLSPGDRVLVLDCGRFAAIWGEMAAFDGLEVELITPRRGRAIDPARVEDRLRADHEHVDQGGAHRARRHRVVGAQRHARDPSCDRCGRPSGAVHGRLHRVDRLRAVRDGRVGRRRHRRRPPRRV